MKKLRVLILLCLLLPAMANAEDQAKEGGEPEKPEVLLESYEANKIGFTFDENDVGYMDFTLSLKYPIVISKNNVIDAKAKDPGFFTKYLLPVPYLAFTGRFGQYLLTRDSSPVIGKRFNPKVFLRFFKSNPQSSYLDIGYAHESNGQRIHSAGSYQDLRADFASEGEDPEFANDYISRGWDYWEMHWFKRFNGEEDFSSEISLKYFIEDGYLQGEMEEFNSWENSREGRQRKEVDGIMVKLSFKKPTRDIPKPIRMVVKYIPEKFKKVIKYIPDFLYSLPIGYGGSSVIYTTGYKDAFSNNTIRGEVLLRFGDLPIQFWISEGYNSDLIDYYQRVRSSGFCLNLETSLL